MENKIADISMRVVDKIKHEYLLRKIEWTNIVPPLDDPAKNHVPVIVSLTSFPERFESLKKCLKSLLLQNTLPERIIVWLGSDSKNYDVQKEFSDCIKMGVEFYIDDSIDIKSHKKYYYTRLQFPSVPFITVDDDLAYPSDLIDSLWNSYLKYPNCISARRVHEITWNNKKQINLYEKWNGTYTKCSTPSYMLFPTTGAGTLFPPYSLPDEALNVERLTQLSLFADDVWLKFMTILGRRKVVWVKNNMIMPATIKGTQKNTLSAENVNNSRNDIYIKNIMEFYDIRFDQFVD